MSANKINNFKFTPDEFTLKIKDTVPNSMQIRSEQSKEKKVRYTLLSSKTRAFLRPYFKEYPSKTYLFEEQFGGHYSTRTIQTVFKKQ